MKASIFISLICATLAFTHAVAKLEGHESRSAVVRVAYHVWYEPNIETDHVEARRDVGIEDKSSFYQVMAAAASTGDASDEQYQFTAVNTTFGRYITSIGGYAEDPARNVFWMLYKFPIGEEPNPQNPPPDSYLSDLGIDAIQVSNSELYLFWRKIVVW